MVSRFFTGGEEVGFEVAQGKKSLQAVDVVKCQGIEVPSKEPGSVSIPCSFRMNPLPEGGVSKVSYLQRGGENGKTTQKFLPEEF